MSKKTITVTVKISRELQLPVLPNFIRDDKGEAIPIEDLTQSQLQEIGQQWTDALMYKARERSGASKDDWL